MILASGKLLARAGFVAAALAAACSGAGPAELGDATSVSTVGSSLAPTASVSTASPIPEASTTHAPSTSMSPVVDRLCPVLERRTGPGLRASPTGQLASWRHQVVEIGGGFAHVTLVGVTDDATGLIIEVNDVLWSAPSALDPDLDRVTLLGNLQVDPSMLEFPVEVVSLVSNDGVAWSVGAVDASGCISQLAGFSGLDLTPAVADLTNAWDGFLGWPRGSVCDDIVVPSQPDRDDLVIAEFLSLVGDREAEAERLADIDQLADRLSVRLHASANDIKRQLLAGVAEEDLELRPLGQVIIRIPSLPDDAPSMLRVFFEGDPPEFLAWGHAERRSSVELLLPRLDNTVYAYVGTFEQLPDGFECPTEYTDLEPYAIIPADAFYPPNDRVNLDNWRP